MIDLCGATPTAPQVYDACGQPEPPPVAELLPQAPPAQWLVPYEGAWARGLRALEGLRHGQAQEHEPQDHERQTALVRQPARTWWGGVLVQPARVVLGLRAFEDAFEAVTVSGQPLVLFDLEKITRMALRQSGLALQILGQPGAAWLARGWHPHELLRACVSREVLSCFADVTARAAWRAQQRLEPGAQEALDDGDALLMELAQLLTGATLARDGALSYGVPELLGSWPALSARAILQEVCERGRRDALDAARRTSAGRGALVQSVQMLRAWLEPSRAVALPARPADYEGAQQQLIQARLLTLAG